MKNPLNIELQLNGIIEGLESFINDDCAFFNYGRYLSKNGISYTKNGFIHFYKTNWKLNHLKSKNINW